MDQYQERYLAHQEKKRKELTQAMKDRHSVRVFSSKQIDTDTINVLRAATDMAPSSCNRRGVKAFLATSRDNKQLLSGLLVGGVGWIHRASALMLFVADKTAYKEGLGFMPYLDAGFMAQNAWIEATMRGISACFVNPNVRHQHEPVLKNVLALGDNEFLCGVLALGYKDED